MHFDVETFKRNLRPAGVFMGTLIIVLGYVQDGLGVIKWGLPTWAFQAAGAILVIACLYLIITRHEHPAESDPVLAGSGGGGGGGGGAGGLGAGEALGNVEFYRDRVTMTKARGSLKQELTSAFVIWASWYTGTYAALEEVFAATQKPQRLILFNPNSPLMPETAKHFKRSQEQFRQDIQTTIEKAKAEGIEVRLFGGPMTLMVIGNPESGNGWVRLELTIPGSAVRPSIVIDQAHDPELFQECVRAYKTMWNSPLTLQIG